MTANDFQPAFLIFTIFDAWAIFSNVLVLTVMYRSRRLRQSFGCVVVSLASVDLLTSIVITPLAIFYYVTIFFFHFLFAITLHFFLSLQTNHNQWHLGSIWCIIWVTLNVFFCTTSVSHHCSIAINRYIAVARPHSHLNLKETSGVSAVKFSSYFL